MSLYQAETRRLVKRRFTKVFVTLTLLALAVVVAGTAFVSRQHTPEAMAQARAEALADYREQVAVAAQDKANCQAAPAQYGGNCENLWTPTPADFVAENYLPPSFDFRDGFADMVVVLAALMAVVAFTIGASFVGVEWRSGGMMNLLLWRPQRLRVLSTKLTALLAGLGGLTVLALAAWTGALWAVARFRGTTQGVTAGTWQSFGLTGLRALVLVLALGALGFGLASIGRHTAAAFGVVVAVVVVLQFGLAIVLQLAEARFADLYLLNYWAEAWMYKRAEVYDYNAPCDYNAVSGCETPVFEITWQMSGGLMLAVVALVLGVAMWTMRSRDIT